MRGVLAVDLERVERLVAARVTRRFERRERTVAEAREERAGVVDADLLHFAGERVFAFFDERLGHRGDGVDRAVEPQRGVDAVREQIAGDAAAGDLHIQPPEARAALRQIGADRPVLQKLRAIMENSAEPAFVDELLGQRDGGNAAVIIPNHVRHLRLLDGGHHLLRLPGRSSPAAFRTESSCRLWRRRWRSRRGHCSARRCRSGRCRRAR